MKLTFALLAALGIASLANAAILPTFVSETSAGAGLWAYTYQIDVQAPDQEIAPSATGPAGTYNNHFTFIDFLGLTGTPTSTGLVASSFSAPSITATGPAAFNQAPTDSASISNVTWTYTGSGIIAPGTTLGTVTLVSTYSTAANAYQQFEGQATKSTGISAGTVTGNSALIVGPSAVPEPGTILLMSGAIAGLALIRRRKATR